MIPPPPQFLKRGAYFWDIWATFKIKLIYSSETKKKCTILKQKKNAK